MRKEVYQKPEIEVIEVEIEGVLALSPGGPPSPGRWGQTESNHDDIINDMFKSNKA